MLEKIKICFFAALFHNTTKLKKAIVNSWLDNNCFYISAKILTIINSIALLDCFLNYKNQYNIIDTVIDRINIEINPIFIEVIKYCLCILLWYLTSFLLAFSAFLIITTSNRKFLSFSKKKTKAISVLLIFLFVILFLLSILFDVSKNNNITGIVVNPLIIFCFTTVFIIRARQQTS